MVVSINQYVYTNPGGDRRECIPGYHKSRDAYRLSAVPDVACLVSIEVRMDLDLERLALRNALLLPDEEPVQQKQEVVQVAGDVENRPPLHEPHVLWILLIPDDEADACNLLQVDKRGRQRAVGRICAAEVIFEALAQAEANAALSIVVDLDLPQRDAVTLESLPTVSRIVGVLVDADLYRGDLRPAAGRR